MGFGAFAGGFAKTFDAKAVGGAIRDYNATSNYDKSMEEANKKYDADMLALNNARIGKQAENDMDTGKGLANAKALPLAPGADGGQQVALSGAPASPVPSAEGREDPSAHYAKDGVMRMDISGTGLPAQGQQQRAITDSPRQPMSDRDYERRSGEIMMAKQQAGLQARRKYYMDMGQADKAMEVDKQIDKMNWHAGMMNKYYDFMDGKAPDVDRAVLGAVNAMMPRGQKYVAGENGTYNLVDAKGNVLQAGLEFTPQQKMAGFQQAYAMADFLRSGDFDAFMGRSEKQQNMNMAIRKQTNTETHDQATEDYQRENLKETARHHRVSEGLSAVANQLRRERNEIYKQKATGGANGKSGFKYSADPQDPNSQIFSTSDGRNLARYNPVTGDYFPMDMSYEQFIAKKQQLAKNGVTTGLDADSGRFMYYPIGGESGRGYSSEEEAMRAGLDSRTKALKGGSSGAGSGATPPSAGKIPRGAPKPKPKETALKKPQFTNGYPTRQLERSAAYHEEQARKKREAAGKK